MKAQDGQSEEEKDFQPTSKTMAEGASRHFTFEAEVPAEWQIGDVILDLYEVKPVYTSSGEAKPAFKGGMGLVYRVHHRDWDIDLAVKSPRPDFFKTDAHRQDFIHEAETWINLGLHPHIVSCFYVRTLGGIPRLFAEYIEGSSLAEWIRDGRLYKGDKRTTLERMLSIAIQTAWGLFYAHEFEYKEENKPKKGLVHQDVKPDNIMMTPDCTAKLTDFGQGVTKAYRSPEQSPEQSPGQIITHQTDIWSWGILVLEMFIGEVRWLEDGQAAADSLAEYLKSGPSNSKIPRMPAKLADLLKHCFQKSPADRPATMLEVASTLKEIYRREIGVSYPRQMPDAAKLRADSLNNKAASLWDLGRTREAEAIWQEALEADATHPESTYNLGLVMWRDGRQMDSTLLNSIQEIITSHPDQWVPVWLLSQVHLERGDCEGALEELKRLDATGRNRVEVSKTNRQAQELLPISRRVLRRFEDQPDKVISVLLPAEGTHIGTVGIYNKFELWNTKTGLCLNSFNEKNVMSVDLSKDGRYALSGSEDKTLTLWDVQSGRSLHIFQGHNGRVSSVCLSRDGRLALSGSGDGTLKLWNLKNRRCLRTFKESKLKRQKGYGYVSSAYLSADGLYALSGSLQGALNLWNVKNGRCLYTFEGHVGEITSVYMSEDGYYALSGSADRTLKLWDVKSKSCLRTFKGHEAEIQAIRLTRDGRYCLSGDKEGVLKLWEIATGRCLYTFEPNKDAKGPTEKYYFIRLSDDGYYAMSVPDQSDHTPKFLSISSDYSYHTPMVISLRIESQAASSAQETYEHSLAQAQEALHSGNIVAAAQHIRTARKQSGYQRAAEAVQEWHRLYLRLARKSLIDGWASITIAGHEERVLAVCMSRDGQYVLSGGRGGDGVLKLWDATTGSCLRTFSGHTHPVTAVCLSKDGRYALSGSSDKTLKLWSLESGDCIRTFKGHKEGVTSACLSADERHVLSGSLDGTLKLWEAKSGEPLRTFDWYGIIPWSVCLSEDTRYVLAGGGNAVKLWDLESGDCLDTFLEHTSTVFSVCLSKDGRYALSGSLDKTLRLWEVGSGRCLQIFEGHTDNVSSVCLSYDGRYALSGSWDHTLKLWDVEKGRCLRTFQGHADMVTSVYLSEDGYYALSGSGDGTIKKWVLDWELEDNTLVDWDERARPYLEMFLSAHAPINKIIFPLDHELTCKEIEELARAQVGRHSRPVWEEDDFQQLLYTLGCAGYGWLRSEGVRRELEKMAADWQGSPLRGEPNS